MWGPRTIRVESLAPDPTIYYVRRRNAFGLVKKTDNSPLGYVHEYGKTDRRIVSSTRRTIRWKMSAGRCLSDCETRMMNELGPSHRLGRTKARKLSRQCVCVRTPNNVIFNKTIFIIYINIYSQSCTFVVAKLCRTDFDEISRRMFRLRPPETVAIVHRLIDIQPPRKKCEKKNQCRLTYTATLRWKLVHLNVFETFDCCNVILARGFTDVL